MDVDVLEGRAAAMTAIQTYAQQDCGVHAGPWRPKGTLYNRDALNSSLGDSAGAAFCHNARHELRLRRGLRDHLERLEAGDAEGVMNAYALVHRLIRVAADSSRNLGLEFSSGTMDDGAEHRRTWWQVATIEWILVSSLATPEAVPSVDPDGLLFESPFDPVPADINEQIRMIRGAQNEREGALALAQLLCGFDDYIFEAGDEVELLQRLWALGDE